ncbi:MAG: UvrD-helicase domain-containing protein [Muribaculaceae bacterium]|nr:UvrD-helicase domain-containing protein [Muribaculaceae bacterium]
MIELLELHRASAGSGKTYTLARKFLWYFLTIRDNAEDLNSPRRLRTEPELRDSLKHILAVTFTNKATNEMKQRIVEKLDALAWPKMSYRNGNLDDEPDYMRDFIIGLNGLDPSLTKEEYAEAWKSDDLDVKWSDISNLARKGLYILLENYSDFQVSTIDSFFQTVLRTFAYETDLNDSYAIELDSDYLSKVSIDATLQDIEESYASDDVRYWIRLLMQNSREKGDSSWNLFQKRDNSIYSSFIAWLKKLENEEFKKIRSDLESYFDSNPDLCGLYRRMEKRTNDALKPEWKKMTRSAHDLLGILDTTDIFNPTIKKFKDHAQKSIGFKFNVKVAGYSPIEDFGGKTYLDRKKEDPELYSRLEDAYIQMREAYKAWKEKFESPEVKHWALYRQNFPYLGLLSIVLRKRREYLEDNNSVELGETNTLLHKIIGKDDAPFIYERLGTRLNHYLIDEFQDTSEMQWQNFKPLLHESLGRGNENLLIGDAKQSIYRFRNADSSLISSKVDLQFGEYVKHFGDRPEENTNYRSSERVVEFNNGFFSFVKERLGEEVSDCGGSIDFRNLYANVYQNFSGRKSLRNGYVEVNFIKAAKVDEAKEIVVAQLPGLINELRHRGYRLRDIALLVRANEEGERIINRLTAYNSETSNASEKIEFVSEQSLKLSGSVAVKLILNTLTSISKGVNPEVRSGEEAIRRGVVNWQEMESNFRVFALKHPELSTPEKIRIFLESGSDSDAIATMLADMKAVTLPALVESIAATFLPEDIRQRDLAFISAFQDIVLEYCESHPSDIASFLLWWQRRGLSAAIASPEDMDAVKVMTIHKSKGLEFPCVIIPFAQDEFNSAGRKSEWRWVKPYGFEGEKLPDYIPVETTSSLEATDHENLYREFLDLRSMDTLNNLYVGFTRAVSELYIFCKDEAEPKKKSKKGADKGEGPSAKSLAVSSLLREYLEAGPEDEQVTIGEKITKSPDKDSKSGADGDGEKSKIVEYKMRTKLDFLKYRTDATSTVKTIDDDEDDDEDVDPRSEGNICHAIMEHIRTAGDIPSAVNRMVHKGLLPLAERDVIIGKFERWLSEPEVKGWFDGSCSVKAERSIVKKSVGKSVGDDGKKRKGGVLLRPDRIMTYPDGSVVIVDYKFGDFKNHKKYARQIKNYIYKLRSTGKYKSVAGYLWYVKEGKLEKFG